MSKLLQKLTRRRDLSLLTDKTSKRPLLIGSVIATLIAITPYLFYLYESVPETQVWDTFLFTYDSKSWGDANFVMWIFVGKMIPLLLITIWFFTCRQWWYHVLIVPMAMYIYQIFGLFNENIPYLDEFQLMHLVPIMAIVIPSIYLIRAQMFSSINDVNKTMEELEEEFKIKPKSFLQKLGDYF